MGRIVRRLDRRHGAVRFGHYPWRASREPRGGGVRVWLGIGGNIGDVPRRFERLWYRMRGRSDLQPVECSPILINPPFGFLDQPDFYNAVVVIQTRLAPLDLLRRLQRIEHRFGRRRSFRDAPRTLDIDILFYGDRRIADPRLQIPHRGWKERISVLWPLAQLREGIPRQRIRG